MTYEEELERLSLQEALADYDGEDKIVTSKEVWESLEEERNQPVNKFFTKIPKLDRMLDGWREGDLIVVSGITKQGKTSLCQTFTCNLAEQNIGCLWFSYELSLLEFLSKFRPVLPIFTLPLKLQKSSLIWLEQRIAESQAKYGTKIIFIDHLHYLLDIKELLNSRQNVSIVIGALMRELKKIATRNKVCIVLVAHTTKIKFDKDPGLDAIRDSSFIAQEADTVLMIWRRVVNKIATNEARLSVLANRRTGENGKINLIFKDGVFYEEVQNYDNQQIIGRATAEM